MSAVFDHACRDGPEYCGYVMCLGGLLLVEDAAYNYLYRLKICAHIFDEHGIHEGCSQCSSHKRSSTAAPVRWKNYRPLLDAGFVITSSNEVSEVSVRHR